MMELIKRHKKLFIAWLALHVAAGVFALFYYFG